MSVAIGWATILFRCIPETATERLWRYNAERSNMAPGGMTPYQKMADAA